VADPYATSRPDLSARPEGPPPWEGEVTGRGGALVGPGGEVDNRADFLVVPCRGIGMLPPVTRLEPAAAVLLWLEHAAADRDAATANGLLARLDSDERPILGIKHGLVGGPADRPGCAEVMADLIAAVLSEPGGVTWERDPDFGYEVPAAVPGLPEQAARVLEPRLLYADNDRVYEHAGLVADKKRERHAIAAAMEGVDPRVTSAAGWPAVATGDEWRDAA
jgi:hypothetical protein